MISSIRKQIILMLAFCIWSSPGAIAKDQKSTVKAPFRPGRKLLGIPAEVGWHLEDYAYVRLPKSIYDQARAVIAEAEKGESGKNPAGKSRKKVLSYTSGGERTPIRILDSEGKGILITQAGLNFYRDALLIRPIPDVRYHNDTVRLKNEDVRVLVQTLRFCANTAGANGKVKKAEEVSALADKIEASKTSKAAKN